MASLSAHLRAAEQQPLLYNRIQQTCSLFTDCPADLHKDQQYAQTRVQLQKALCTALLQSLQPATLACGSQLSTAKQRLQPPPPRKQHISQSQQQAQTTNGTQPCSPDAENSQRLILILDEPNTCSQSAADPNVNTTAVTLASAWTAARPALQTIYTWEDEDVVTCVITFWSGVVETLHGDWLQKGSELSSSTHLQQPQDQLHQQQSYILWLQQLGHPALSAVVQLLHDFYNLTGISHAQHKPRTPLSVLLLLFLQLHPSTSDASRSCNSLAEASTAQQFLQLLHWPQHGGIGVAASTATALTASEAFSGTCKLLQMLVVPASAQLDYGLATAAVDPLPNGPNGCSNPENGSRSSDVAWEQIASAAAEFLQSAYGWVPLGMPALSSHSNSGRRPEDTAYDCCMLELLHGMYQGPTAAGRHPQQQLSTAASQQGTQRGRGSGSKESKEEKQQAERWNSWCESDGFKALAELIVTYDKPHLLIRGLMALILQQQQQQGNSSVSETAAAVLRAEKSVQAKVVQLLESVYLSPYQPAETAAEQTAAAGAVCKLLQGCAGLLRPAANCTVEWRCAALGLMIRAVEDFNEMHQDSGELHSALWCDDSLEGLLYCLNHDSSIKVRRTAMKLLQLVVLPSGSHAAAHLVKTLAAKVCDKDDTVGQAALELLVQLDARMTCNILTASQWSAVVQAGLQLCSSAGADAEDGHVQTPGKQGRRASQHSASQAMCSDGQQQFLGLLKTVLLFDAAGPDSQPGLQQAQLKQLHSMHGHQIRQWLMASAHKVVGIGGCRVLLLLLLQNPELEMLCHAVADACSRG